MKPAKPLKSLTDKALYARCKEYGQNARLWRRKFAGLLPEVLRRSLYRRRKFGSIYEFAAKLGGMSKESVDKVLQISRKLEDKPLLKGLLESGAQGWSKLERVAYIATPQTEDYWADKVQTLSLAPLKVFVQNSRLETAVDRSSQPENSTTQELRLNLSHELAKKLEQISKRADFEQLLQKFVTEVEEHEAATKPAAAVTSSRHMPVEIERFVRQRTNGLCAFPGCRKPGTSIHHTQRWALENIHDPDRMHLLCIAHERIAHASLIENEEMSPEHWRIRTEAPNPLAVLSPKGFIDSLVAIKRRGG